MLSLLIQDVEAGMIYTYTAAKIKDPATEPPPPLPVSYYNNL